MIFPSRLLLASVKALIAVAVLTGTTISQANAGGSCCSSESGGTKTADGASCHADQPVAQQRSESPFQAPHGGQLIKTLWNFYEVVYGPQDSRVYLYDIYRSPVSAGGIQGWAIMRVRSTGGEFRYPVRYVPVAGGQDYLAVRVDLTRVHDGDMDVYFDLANLRNRAEPTVRFAQTYAMTRQPPPPAVAPNYLAQPQVVVTTATRADDPAIRAQGVCPVMKQPLGSHGAPTKIVVGGRSLFVCCEGCVDKVKQNPGLYLARANG